MRTRVPFGEGGSPTARLSKLLSRRPEYDLVDVEVFGLAHRERHHAREARRRHADPADVFLVSGLDVLVGDVIKQLGRYRTRRDDGRADVVGLDFLTQTFRQG